MMAIVSKWIGKLDIEKKIVFGDSNDRFVLHSIDILFVYENH